MRDNELTEASITALALEESLLRQWSELYDKVEALPTPPVTRAAADEFRDYSQHAAFVDSVVDALSLYLAGRSEFDGKFGSYLELLLIQRAEAEDLEVLAKLATKYRGETNLVGLMGLSHRIGLYAGDPRLVDLFEKCSALLREFDQPTDTLSWAASVGITPMTESWSVSLRFGTAPANYWVMRKNDLKPNDVSLDLLISAREWRIQVARVDRAYSAQWRSAGISVATEEQRLKALSAWPSVTNQQLFPAFAANLAEFLQVKWDRMAWLSARDVEISKPRLLEWLHTCVDVIRP
jgi:hypothetical protein